MAFLVGATAKGPKQKAVSSLSDYVATFGDRVGFTDAYDAAEVFYREGGTLLTVGRTNPTVNPTGFAAEADDAGEEDEAPKSSRRGKAAEAEPMVLDPGIATALGNLPRDLGPGQIFATGTVGQAVDTHTALLAHAGANNRIALLDTAPATTATALAALAATYSADANARRAALFAPGAIVPGVTVGATRTVPYSAVEAGIMSRNGALYGPNVPAAGVNGVSRFAIDLAVTFTDAERETLNTAGVDTAKLIYGDVRTYGYRTLAPVSTGWALLSNARLNMEIVAKAEAIGERYLFAQIDGRRVKISQFGADLSGMLVPYYEAGSLFGESAADAFYVDVGPAVNTLETIAAGELHAVIGVRMAPFAEYVVIEIVKVATETPLAVAA